MIIYKNIYKYIKTCTHIHGASIHRFISFLCQLKDLKKITPQWKQAHQLFRYWFLLPLSNNRNQDFLILGLREEIYKMSGKQLVRSESIKMKKMDASMLKKHRSP